MLNFVSLRIIAHSIFAVNTFFAVLRPTDFILVNTRKFSIILANAQNAKQNFIYASLRGRGTSLPACEAKPRDGGEPLRLRAPEAAEYKACLFITFP